MDGVGVIVGMGVGSLVFVGLGVAVSVTVGDGVGVRLAVGVVVDSTTTGRDTAAIIGDIVPQIVGQAR